jgi:hypothetical protein
MKNYDYPIFWLNKLRQTGGNWLQISHGHVRKIVIFFVNNF